jgi:hypothetical protein
MTDWRDYLNDRESSSFKKKKTRPGCKRNKISKTRNGPCSFNENDDCIFCKRPRKKEHRFDPTTNTVVVHYFE